MSAIWSQESSSTAWWKIPAGHLVYRVAAGGDRLDSCAGNTTPIGVAANDHGAPTLKSPDLSGAPLSFDCHKRGARRVNEGTEPDPADPGTGRHDDLAIT
ncbi:hypothetical protein [Chachezhania antarctica]|uniref:hypothetical protein n=1 Tax=Chachezhania antarctica TaxID=2340860 RepID=UPI001F094927|nr:hypothetical protein [Chachezhania antarctica]|tara:strand:+ start:9512 stop:9811 length:300 start_codon:yes stop_codon:yes gene_type:complete